jgi:hypothetical protein
MSRHHRLLNFAIVTLGSLSLWAAFLYLAIRAWQLQFPGPG